MSKIDWRSYWFGVACMGVADIIARMILSMW